MPPDRDKPVFGAVKVTTAQPTVAVSFEESERITRSGSTTTTYLVLLDRVWQPLQRLATAAVQLAAPTPGVVWRRIITVSLPVGSEIERVVEVPKRELQANTSDILFGRNRGLKHERRRTRFIVQRGGKLLAV